MPIKPDALAESLKRGLKPLYALIGDEPLVALECADVIRSAARAQGFTERQVFIVDTYFKWQALASATASMGLFDDRKLIELRMPTGKPGRDGSEPLATWCAALVGDAKGSDLSTLAIVTLPKPDSAARKAVWFGALESNALVVSCDAIARNELPRWIATRLRRHQQSASDDALSFMAARFEGNLVAAHQEIEKLALLYEPGKLELAQVQAVVANVARYDVFALSDAALNGDVPRVLRMLDGLQAEGESPVLVHFTLQQEVRQLLAVKVALASGKPIQMALREAGVWGPRQITLERVAPRVNAQTLAPLLAEAAAVDLICKGLPQPDLPREPWAALRHFALGLIAAASNGKALALAA